MGTGAGSQLVLLLVLLLVAFFIRIAFINSVQVGEGTLSSA